MTEIELSIADKIFFLLIVIYIVIMGWMVYAVFTENVEFLKVLFLGGLIIVLLAFGVITVDMYRPKKK